MSRLRSLCVIPSVMTDGDLVARMLVAVNSLFLDQFTSLVHLNIACGLFLMRLTTCQLPQLSSLTIIPPTVEESDFRHITAHTFRLSVPDKVSVLLLRPPAHVQYLSLSSTEDDLAEDRRTHHVFPPNSVARITLSSLVYLDFLDGLTLADITYLLDATSPPVFATQLTHLALRVQSFDRADAAALLPSLSTMYPSLTHVHIGVHDKLDGERLDECAEWDAAVQKMKGEVRSAWCDSVGGVVCWREDVAWRRSAGLPAPTELLDDIVI